MPGKPFDPDSERRNTPSCGLINHYEDIASASRSMLDAAHRGDWATVEQIESRCREMIAALKIAASTDTLSEVEKARRMTLLRTILKDDAQIRLRAEPWLRDLENFLSVSRQTAKYGP
jgi:flagellar protein FliT